MKIMMQAIFRQGGTPGPVHCLLTEGFTMQTRIQGTTMPVLDVQLEPNESVLIESGELSWMTALIQMTNYTLRGGVVGSMLGGDK
jgi:uncharacterized protein (AIM24 family)